MKRLDELTEQELCDLTEEEVQTLIQAEAMYEGLPLLPVDPGPKPTCTAPKPDVSLYTIHELYFRTAIDRDKVMDLVASMDLGGWEYVHRRFGNYTKVLTTKTPYGSKDEVYSPELYAQVQADLAFADQVSKEYTEQKDAYDKVMGQQASVAERVRAVVGEAKSKARRREYVQATFDKCMALADDNREIALRFVVQTIPDAKALVPELWPQESPVTL